MNLAQFKALLVRLDSECGHKVPMFNCGVSQIDGNTFAFSYDALCGVIVRFEADGSVKEWVEAVPGDEEHYEAHFTHLDVGVWVEHQKFLVAEPAEGEAA